LSIEAMSEVWKHSRASGSPFLVLLVIADHADEHYYAWPSYETLAFRARISRATVHRSLRQLYDLGELEQVERGGRVGDVKKSNVYRIAIETLRADPSQNETLEARDPSQPETAPSAPRLTRETGTLIGVGSGSSDVAVGSSDVSLETSPSARTRTREAGQANGNGAGEAKESGPPRDLPAEVWAVYVKEMKPRKKTLFPQERAVIRDALRVASVEECIEAIRGCKASSHHMGQNESGKKYNTLSHILRGKSGRRTVREHIDLMRGYLIEGSQIPSDRIGEINQAKEKVRLGLTHPTHDYHREQGEQAQEFLRQFGLEARAVEYEVKPGVMGIRVLWS
jgi:hypothetical protein